MEIENEVRNRQIHENCSDEDLATTYLIGLKMKKKCKQMKVMKRWNQKSNLKYYERGFLKTESKYIDRQNYRKLYKGNLKL